MQNNPIETPSVAVKTDCKQVSLHFPELTERNLAVDFKAGFVSSDGGAVLLARLDRGLGHLERFCQCFSDYRDPELIEHSLEELIRQRVYALALGYEDLNDHERLKSDPLLASLCGKSDPLGKDRLRSNDRGKALAGKSTLNRLELTPANANSSHRYKKIAADEQALEDYFINE